jgi:glycosyltransferase involved in cell wall biosynthesis
MTVYPKISIITPSYNQGLFIEETINSILNQNYPNLEYILIDGGSSDNTLEIIKNYSGHFKFWVSEKDMGQSHAINKGLERVTGDLFIWINSDDFLEPGALWKVADAFLNFPNAVAFSGQTRIIDGKTKGQIKIVQNKVFSDNLSKTIGSERFIQPSCFFNLKVINKSDVSPVNDMHYCMDYERWINILYKYWESPIYESEDIYTNFRLHQFSKSGKEIENFEIEIISIFYEWALFHKLSHELEALTNLQGNTPIKKISIKSFPDKNVSGRAIQYFLLTKSHEYYIQLNFEKSQNLLQYIRPEMFDDTSYNLYKRIKFRGNFLMRNFVRLIK